MALELVGQVGPGAYSDGTAAKLRLDRDGALVTPPGLAEYARRGVLFSGMTAVTGVAPGTAVGTTPAFAIKNPGGSGKVFLVMVTSMGYVSGTLGAGFVVYGVNKAALNATLVIGSGAAIVPYNSRNNGSAAELFTSGTLSVAPTVVRPFASLGASLASTAVAPWTLKDEPMGEIALEPGAILSLQGVGAAGSTPLVVFGMTWAELSL